MIAKTTIGICVALLAFIAVPLSAGAQSSATQKPLKQIGVPEAERTEIVPSLIVLNARGATLNGATLTLLGVASNAIIFADRPVRAAGHALTAHLLEEWADGSDSFAKNPPNATVSVLSKDGSTVKDVVVVLTSPKPEGDNLTFNVRTLEGDLAGGNGPAAVFIDIIGMPFTPLSFAGVARRTARRAAFYSAAAAAAYNPYAYRPPYGALCGYYPYPPCY
jgi:hypothetical protein